MIQYSNVSETNSVSIIRFLTSYHSPDDGDEVGIFYHVSRSLKHWFN